MVATVSEAFQNSLSVWRQRERFLLHRGRCVGGLSEMEQFPQQQFVDVQRQLAQLHSETLKIRHLAKYYSFPKIPNFILYFTHIQN